MSIPVYLGCHHSEAVARELSYYNYARFSAAGVPDFRATDKVINCLASIGSQEARVVAGEVCEDIGVTFPLTTDERLDMFARAEAFWSQSTNTNGLSEDSLYYGITARLGLANLKIVNWVYGHGLIPPDVVTRAHLRSLRRVGEELSKYHDERGITASHLGDEVSSHVAGQVGELAFQWLSERSYFRDGVSETLAVAPATLSQDKLLTDRNGENDRFDLLVLSQLDPTNPPLTDYKVQVKVAGGDRKMHNDPYKKGIKPVYVEEDLAVNYRRGGRLMNKAVDIIRELIVEARHPDDDSTRAISERLDERAQGLQEALDREDEEESVA